MRQLDRLTFKQLRALAVIAEERAIARAAEELSLTPPAVHNQLKTLEETIGCTLLKRSGTDGFEPTPQGAALIGAYHESRAVLERAMWQIDAIDKGLVGDVVLGVVSTAKYFAPGIVARLRRKMPNIRVRLEVANREDTIAALLGRKLDLCIMGRPPRGPDICVAGLADNPHLLVAAPDHPLASKERVAPEDLLSEHFVMREPGSGTRLLAGRFLDEIGGGHIFDTTEMGSNETIKQAVISGLGIAILSGHTMVEELKAGRLVAFHCRGLPILRRWFVVEREDQTSNATAKAVKKWIIANADTLVPAVPV